MRPTAWRRHGVAAHAPVVAIIVRVENEGMQRITGLELKAGSAVPGQNDTPGARSEHVVVVGAVPTGLRDLDDLAPSVARVTRTLHVDVPLRLRLPSGECQNHIARRNADQIWMLDIVSPQILLQGESVAPTAPLIAGDLTGQTAREVIADPIAVVRHIGLGAQDV